MKKQFRLACLGLVAFTSMTVIVGCADTVEDNIKGDIIVIPDIDSQIPPVSTLAEAAGLFRTSQSLVIETDKHKYQAQFNLHMDNYCGYMCLPHSFYGKQPSTYALSVYGYGVTERFLNFCQQVTPIMAYSSKLGVPELAALGDIMFAMGSQIMTDAYGAFPYQHYKKQNQDHPLYYYTGEAIYDSIFDALKNSVKTLEAFKQKPASEQADFQKILTEQDCVAGAQVDNWIKLANSLRLRVAMRLTKVNLARAQKEAEEAVAAGVLTTADKDIAFNYAKSADGSHPLYQIAKTWVDTRMNGSFLNMLQRLKCPLLEEWFEKNAGHADKNGDVIAKDGTVYPANSEYMGIRTGTSMRDQGYATDYINYSSINSAYGFTDIAWIKVTEVLFLQAEGALRGWNMGGSAQSFYDSALQTGLKRELKTGRPASIEQKIANYLLVDKADTSIDYIDYYDQANNCKGVVTVGVTWNESDNLATKLEKIITQKYILNFPLSVEAWSDIRRTGYPKLLPIVADDGDGSILAGDIIRRIPFSISDDAASKEDAELYGLPALGGPDHQGTHIWWDK